jgi:ubiquitin fusion degradation protein 1
MMQNLLIENGGIINISNITLPKGSYVQLQPHSTTFTELSNPRSVLEKALRKFSCMTKGNAVCCLLSAISYSLDHP